jgi:6-phosphogluconolactonase
MSSRVERIRVAENRIPEVAVAHITHALRDAVAERGAASLCLAGGNTPKATYEALARAPGITWPAVSVYFGDERCVPPDDPDSNYGLARTALLDHVGVPSTAVHRIRGEEPDRDAAADAYARALPADLDVLILGIGEDCHTASLFPHSPAVHERRRRVVPVTGPKPPFERITLTPSALEGRLVLVLVAGSSKAEAVAQALEGELDLDTYPAQLARDAVWIMAHAAASKLTGVWRDLP